MNGKLAGKIALITGASRGIGAAVARRFAEEGAQTILLARTASKLEAVDDAIRAAGGLPPVLVIHDLKEHQGLYNLAQQIGQRFGRLDVLVGNAGMLGVLSPLTHTAPKVFNDVMETNVTANWHLIRAFDPLLRASAAGRAMFVSSGIAEMHAAYWGPYAISKAALEMMVGVYAAESKAGTVRVNVIDPGVVRTSMRAAAFPGENPETLPEPDTITDVFVELAETACTRHDERVHVRINPKLASAA